MFLCSIYHTAKNRTLLTYTRDAFFILERIPDKWLPIFLFAVEYSDNELKEILEYMIARDITATRKNPTKDARSYAKHFWHLILFLRITAVIDNAKAPRRIGA